MFSESTNTESACTVNEQGGLTKKKKQQKSKSTPKNKNSLENNNKAWTSGDKTCGKFENSEILTNSVKTSGVKGGLKSTTGFRSKHFNLQFIPSEQLNSPGAVLFKKATNPQKTPQIDDLVKFRDNIDKILRILGSFEVKNTIIKERARNEKHLAESLISKAGELNKEQHTNPIKGQKAPQSRLDQQIKKSHPQALSPKLLSPNYQSAEIMSVLSPSTKLPKSCTTESLANSVKSLQCNEQKTILRVVQRDLELKNKDKRRLKKLYREVQKYEIVRYAVKITGALHLCTRCLVNLDTYRVGFLIKYWILAEFVFYQFFQFSG